ncbi:RNA pyrophosphohydrolase [Altericroceibacterium endophyticum]|uniref:RNA pyrophosphohydrolase n=1 Tax=Altericroceibacterium endophyticum TaxID=1808508 RepID=A0A6I4T3N5_9SPHN|nr:RNA pyrophosphohydrolase [Altericroceibacterium endophyticum]MXO64683.1 RNA pyrophosphohydrolase [Altericroceibacterium endophyticum]
MDNSNLSQPDPALYRPCVGVLLVNGDGQAFVGKRIDNQEGDWWQMPQGGVDPGEALEDAAFRELGEETGAQRENVTLLGRIEDELFYDLPDELKGKLWGGKYLGQRQVWYLARFTGQDSDIDLEAHNPPEFCDWKWVDPELLPDLIVPFKRDIYQQVVSAFRGTF